MTGGYRKWLLVVVALCSGCDDGAQPTEPFTKSGRGESCGATNDCGDGLLCINQTCVQNDYPVAATAKDCILIECNNNADCCGGADPELCGLMCMDDRCVASPSTCAADIDCGGFVCEDDACVQCRDDSNCGSGSCVNNLCQAACSADEECPLFNECKEDACEATGCKSDRECILFTGDARATCQDKTCEVPCTSNAQCGQLQICSSGICVFLGCETNADCRAATGTANVPEGSNVRAVCRARAN
jgi:hypothetical protein